MSATLMEQRIESLLNEGKKLFIPYVMCGDGGFEKTGDLIRVLESAGASIIEIGIPFSDPIADGPTIQAAGQRALDDGVTLKKILSFLKTLPPRHDVPRIIMTYLNPIVQYGLDAFFKELNDAYVSGVIIPDLPLEEYDMISSYTRDNDIAIIPLVAPSTTPDRIERMTDKAKGFIYTVTVNGTTGARQGFAEELTNRLESIKSQTNLPVVAGFGISTKEHIDLLTQHCDGVVVGSRIVELANDGDYESIKALVGSL